MVDEAHAFGILGAGGRGLADELAVAGAVDIHMGTFSKAAGLQGGYVCGPRAMIDCLINRARSFVYSTAPPPALAAAACEVVSRLFPGACGESRRAALRQNLEDFRRGMGDRIAPPQSAIVPLITGSEESALAQSAAVQRAGFLIPAIRYPTVPRGSARLRVTLTAAHSAADVAALTAALTAAAGA
jgi:7-keto-8-aminopelargonate synthetase-like enzyme